MRSGQSPLALRPVVMGILNVTPDSFFDGGRYLDHAAALRRGREMIGEGADVVDVGGESTRPGADPVSDGEELRRVMPVIEVLATEVSVSIDTTKEVVARAAVAAGAVIVNDVSASPRLAELAGEAGAGYVAMHRKGTPADMQLDPTYDDVVTEVSEYLAERAAHARACGVREVWIDPGIGFGKTGRHNLTLLASLRRLSDLGYPVLVGTSRKTFLGRIAAGTREGNGPPLGVEERFEGSLATAVWAMANGASAVRVHDVKATAEAAALFSRLDLAGEPGVVT